MEDYTFDEVDNSFHGILINAEDNIDVWDQVEEVLEAEFSKIVEQLRSVLSWVITLLETVDQKWNE